MNAILKTLSIAVALFTAACIPLYPIIARDFPGYLETYQTGITTLTIILYIAVIYTIVLIWDKSTFTTVAKAIWSIILLVFFPHLSLPLYLWLVEPKHGKSD